ncbi:MAG: hypothetical protein HC792_01655 [Acaryochloridaceae cyanobacterium CSU_5_19]|nr:hypothetical protein [Acaryochloridaceae cyanobacterium CSU_5_19]
MLFCFGLTMFTLPFPVLTLGIASLYLMTIHVLLRQLQKEGPCRPFSLSV